MATVATLALCSAHAHPATPAPGVELADCSDLDAREIERLLALELDALTGPTRPAQPPPVRLTCHDASVRVSVDDPVTGKTLARDVPAPASDDPMRDRIVALAVSELFLSSWLELLLPPETRRVAPAPAPQVVAVGPTARRAAQPPPTRWELELRGSARWRSLDDPYLGYQPSLQAALVLADWIRLFMAAGLELDRVRRERGEVRSRASGLGMGWQLRAGGNRTLFWDVGALLSGVVVQTRGRSSRADTTESSVSGLAWESALLGGPGLHLGRMTLRLEALGGISRPRLVARVAGEAPVRWDGLWLGAAIGIGVREPIP
ncbi:MAG: hypothetical protein JW940_28370 [Polyangiaceae bacterium]|nr:hypothetical protein [Polyangiaceae bacterium]